MGDSLTKISNDQNGGLRVASSGFRPGAGRPLGARNKLYAEQRAQVQKRFPTTLLMRMLEIVFAPDYEIKEVLVKIETA
jgi:hypothetical protein